VLEYLAIKQDGWYLDGTLGDGGHTLLIASAGARVWGLDQDTEAITRAGFRLQDSLDDPLEIFLRNVQPVKDETRLVITHGHFEDCQQIWKQLNLPLLEGILLDLGASTVQLTKVDRGFSFESDNLDMRMDQTRAVTAADLVNALSERELSSLFSELGGEHSANKIAQAIVRQRFNERITSGKQLADLVARIKPRHGKLHPATQVFQALRMAVNTERLALEQGLPLAFSLLKSGGRLVTIAFHEGEDALVKRFSKQKQLEGTGSILTKKPIVPSEKEIKENPRARSAKLRALEKI
jgi:16S rRNA (cytosine1402-N4)-methyltransferase